MDRDKRIHDLISIGIVFCFLSFVFYFQVFVVTFSHWIWVLQTGGNTISGFRSGIYGFAVLMIAGVGMLIPYIGLRLMSAKAAKFAGLALIFAAIIGLGGVGLMMVYSLYLFSDQSIGFFLPFILGTGLYVYAGFLAYEYAPKGEILE